MAQCGDVATENEIVLLTRRLLDAIAGGDWEAYVELSDESLTAFEPEALGQLITGLPFHKFYFDLGGVRGPHQITLAAPRVHLLNNTAVIAYVRVIQQTDANRMPKSTAFEETRVWQCTKGRWRQVHFHRSRPTTTT